MTRPMFQGSIVALVTPFRNGKVDEAKLRELVDIHVAQGTDGIVPCGTTGESPTLSHDEHKRVVEIVIDAARGRLPIIAGTGSNATSEAIDLTAHAKKAGATGALVVNPYYNRPTQEGLYRHFRAVAEAVDIPIIVYNIAGRTAVNVETDTMARLVRDCPNIVGVKEASGSLDQMTQVILACGPDFSVLSGDDNITLPLMSVGGRGVISVIANVVPRETAEMTHAALAGDWKLARELHLKLFPLSRAMFIETNPIPVKETMALMGMIEPEFRLPMCRMSEANRARLLRGARAVRPREALSRRSAMADVVVAGAAGRMGSRLVALLQEDKDLRLVAALEAPGHPAVSRDAGEVAGVGRLGVPITDDPESVLGQDRILVEFSVPAASLSHLQSIARLGGRAVIGTTGLSAAAAPGGRSAWPGRFPSCSHPT